MKKQEGFTLIELVGVAGATATIALVAGLLIK